MRGLRLVFVLGVAAALAGSAPLGAQSLKLGVGTPETLYYPGDHLELAVSASNPGGLAASADFFAGLILPDGATVATLGPGGAVRVGALSAPGAFLPLARGIGLGGAFSAAIDPLFSYAWTGSEPIGLYTVFLVAVRAGSFDDNRIDAGDLLAVQFGGLAVRQPATTQTAGTTTSATVSATAGGTMDVAAPGGVRYQLVVPPGALDHDMVLSATPVSAIAGVPLSETLGAVRFSPDGLRLQRPATLTITLPAPPKPKGVVGFSVRDDGTGFALHPATAAGTAITIPVTHFSSTGGGFIDCRGVVTTAVGLAACANMQTKLDEAVQIIDGGVDNFSVPLRNLLASEIATELRPWLTQVVIGAFTDAATLDTSSTVDYFFLTAEREWSTIRAIADLAEGLNVSTVLRPEFAQADTLFPAALAGRQRAANTSCSTDRAHASGAIRRLQTLSAMAQEHGLAVDRNTQGITCLTIAISGALDATPVPRSGATLTASASLRHSDGGLILDSALAFPITMVAADSGRATFGGPTSAGGGAGQPAELTVPVTPHQGGGSDMVITLSAVVPALGLGSTRVVSAPIAQGFAVAPATVHMRPGDTQQFVVTEDGAPTLFPVGWTATGGAVSPGGLYTAGATEGRFQATAAIDTGNNVTVVRSALISIGRLAVSPVATTLRPGQSRTFTATRDGQPVSATWSAPQGIFSPTTGSTVTYTAGPSAGPVAVLADDGQGNTGTADVTVEGVLVTPAQISVAPGQTQQFTAVVEGAANQAVTWALSGTTAGSTVSATGLFTAGSSPTTVFVTATSVADPSSVGIAQVTVEGANPTDATLSISGLPVGACSDVNIPHGTVPLHGVLTCSGGVMADATVNASATSASLDIIAATPASSPGQSETSAEVFYRATRSGIATISINASWTARSWNAQARLSLSGDVAAVDKNFDGRVTFSRPTVSVPVQAGTVFSVTFFSACGPGCQGFGRMATVTLP